MRTLLLSIMVLTARTLLGAEVLSWQDCVREAGKNNTELRAAAEAVSKAEAEYSSSHSAFLPTVSASAGYNRGNSSGGGAFSGASSSVSDQYSLGVSVTENIFNGFKDVASLNQAKGSLEASRAAFRDQKVKLHYDLKVAFFGLLYAQEVLELSRQVENRRKGNLDLVELRFEGGRENKGSFLKTKSQYRQASYEVAQAQRGLEVAEQEIQRLLGRGSFSPVTVTGKLITQPIPDGRPDFQSLVKTIPSYQQNEAERQTAEAGVNKAYGGFLPSLALTGAYSRTGSDFPLDGNRWSVGATLSIPIFDGAANIFNLQAAKASEAKAEISVRSQTLSLLVQLERAYQDLKGAIDKVSVSEEIVQAAEVRAEIARSQYNTGIITYNDWDIIENDQITQQQQLLMARRDAVKAESNWEQVQGKGDIP